MCYMGRRNERWVTKLSALYANLGGEVGYGRDYIPTYVVPRLPIVQPRTS